MVFSSLFFLCCFLPLSLGLYYVIKDRTYRNCVLIIESLVFYAWGEPIWITVLLLATAIVYFCALAAEKYRGTGRGRAFVTLCIIANLAVLGFFKYSGFVIENINQLFGTNLKSVEYGLPIGISFFTFQVISYIVDVYKGEVEAQKSPFKLLLFVSLFHKLVNGPIVRYKDVEYDIDNRVETLALFNEGVGRFIIGLGKKAILAGMAGEVSKAFLGTDYMKLPVLGAWLGIILYAFQIYFDFSGYSDMAIGLGKMFGFSYKENFNYPYISRSASEFWRRWHISLSSFFRDYVYIPLGGNRKYQVRNLLVVWFLTGLWHGASWNFVLWGLYFFVLLVIEKFILNKLFEKIPSIFSRIYFIIAVLVGWVFFYHTDLSQAITFLGVMFGINAVSLSSPEVSIYFGNNAVFLIIACIGCTPLAKWLYQKIKDRMKSEKGSKILESMIKPAFNIIILILSVVFLVGQSYNPFLYFKF